MADAVVSSILQQLAKIVDREVEQELRLIVGVKQEVEKMRSTFRTIQAVLVDAEKRHFREEAVKVWLDKLKHISYDIDDVLDEWNTAILKSQIERDIHPHQSLLSSFLPSKVRSCIPYPCSRFGGLAFRHDIALKIKGLNEMLQGIAREKDDFSFTISNTDLNFERPKTTSLIDESDVYGRDRDKDVLVDVLTDNNGEGIVGKGISLVAIIAFLGRSIEDCENFESIGRQFVKKCAGLPLAIKTLASLLRFKRTKEQWQKILDTSDGIEVQRQVESPHGNVRHLTLIPHGDHVPILDPIKGVEKLRSFLVPFSYCDDTPKAYAALPKLFHQLISLRMLGFYCKPFQRHFVGILEIPNEIGKLIHLRYLSLEGNKGLFELPETVCDLCNLQTLNIRRCFNLRKLPPRMEKLINLRHLQNAETFSITFMPKGMQRLTSLQSLEWFVVKKEGASNESETSSSSLSCSLEDLGNLIHLRGHLWIRELGNYVGEEASEARPKETTPLSAKAGLRELSLSFGGGDDKEQEKRMEDEASVVQALHPPPQLESLRIGCCKGPALVLPDWMLSLTSLKSVELLNCSNWEFLPPMGKLPSLESLTIEYMKKVKRVGEEFLGVGVETNEGQASTSTCCSSSSVNQNIAYFPGLKQLQFHSMYGWEEWEYECEKVVFRSRGDESSSSSSSSNILPIIMPKLQRTLILKRMPKVEDVATPSSSKSSSPTIGDS
ncbi:NB-ARC domain-containing protein [Corchorus olitorius]|uniref:NB-ARC domain-containing protein n=1 Tax=Corchorus olitorius TaxID=93759 RepID=A0A1R3H7T3_9ROSI|nr:NB-ARC domain-containing protein [Corchorus olitorius]